MNGSWVYPEGVGYMLAFHGMQRATYHVRNAVVLYSVIRHRSTAFPKGRIKAILTAALVDFGTREMRV